MTLFYFAAWLPYLSLRSTPGVATYTVARFDDGTSPPIPIPTGFPIGNSNASVAYVSGYTNNIFKKLRCTMMCYSGVS